MDAEYKALVTGADAVPAKAVEAGSGTSMQMLIGPDAGPHFAMRRFTIKPGGGMPEHTNKVEHEQYVLRGTARIGIGDKVYSVRAGDVVFIPAGVAHWYKTEGSEPFQFLCIVPNSPDEIKIIEK